MRIVLRGGGKKIVLRQTGRRGPQGEQGPVGPQGPQGEQGIQGEPGEGLPTGGTTGQVPVKQSNADYDIAWETLPAAPVTSVNGQTGAVVLDATDVGADAAGSAAQALSDANDYTDNAVAGVDTGVMSVVAGNNVTVDNTDPANPVISAADAPAPPVTSVNGRTGAVTGLAEQSDLTAHTSNTNNPHNVTKSQVGLGNVDNTSDADKPISTATQNALNLKLDASRVLQGTGFPNGTVTAPVGTIYVDTAVTNGASSWIKKSGTGNTGWAVLEAKVGRIIPESDLLNGWDYETTNAAMRLYREGDIVTLVIALIGLRGTSATASAFYTLPDGFRIGTTGNYGNVGPVWTGPSAMWRVTKDMNSLACDARTSNVSGILTWKTFDDWPTTLPGTPA